MNEKGLVDDFDLAFLKAELKEGMPEYLESLDNYMNGNFDSWGLF